jgi:chromosome partitioning protein
MQIIALISQKGGVGKTTLCIHLATAFVADGYNTLLLDLDPQASAAEWKDARESEEPAVLAVPPSRLPKVIEEARKIGTDIMIIDTAPHSEGTALDAARVADVVLVPCQPSIMDIRAMRKTVDLLSGSSPLTGECPPRPGGSKNLGQNVLRRPSTWSFWLRRSSLNTLWRTPS